MKTDDDKRLIAKGKEGEDGEEDEETTAECRGSIYTSDVGRTKKENVESVRK